MDITGQSAIVTGGGSGLGAATAELLGAGGAKVAVLGRRQEVVRDQAGKIGGVGISCDVSDAEDLERAFAGVRSAHGPARILVNCAGVGGFMPTVGADGSPMPLDAFRHVIEVNLVGTVNAIRLAAADMMRLDELDDGSRGVIICTSSVAGQDGPAGALPYVASKGAIDAMTLSLAREFGNAGIRVVTICPGPIRTPLSESAPPALEQAIKRSLVFPKEMGSPEDYARLALHICENGFINGAVIRLDGGIRSPYMPRPPGAPDAP